MPPFATATVPVTFAALPVIEIPHEPDALEPSAATNVALVEGRINHDTGIIDAPIGRDKNDRKKMCVTSENSKEAVTEFKVLERYKDSSLVECTLKTGRTHQIRVHMAYINHPIVNDPVYNKKKATSFGQMLHAKQIGFIHPVTNKYMEFSVNTPKEFDKILEIYKNK